MRTNNAWTRIVGTILMTVFLFAFPAAYTLAGEPGSQEMQKVRIPQTAEEHRAMAQSYRMKAMNYERDAETHRLMCEGYKFKVSIPENPMVAGPSLREAQRDCERYMQDAKKLAESARELSEYHTAQAKALEGHP